MKPYNGHRSWNAWNVALWIGNDEPVYRFAIECIRLARRAYPEGSNLRVAWSAAWSFMRCYEGERTPDGAVYNPLCVKLAMEGLME